MDTETPKSRNHHLD
jgi:hypothetical protein